MIHSHFEYARVERLVTLMTTALDLIAMARPPADAYVKARVRASFDAQIPLLEEELARYQWRQRQLSAVDRSELAVARARKAQRQIDVLERSLSTLRDHIGRLAHEYPIDHAKLHDAREDLAMHDELLDEWQSVFEDLVTDLDSAPDPTQS
jgi:chromosome segregation ATPase